ncbi:hypothetical protein FY528_06800 [Hymenobacter lutimineralis]|uniref:Carboxypeptidase regulatory-like domain-containing protein n=1 Tax=Hymenobacter lutimineralis TaxID=2606448 RepID=A0A5D6V995_9BACT|nr:hypothetical protein [Hymenobacter lutimineralis]TYZ11399.1 hypothetical protein FY528_06800 [Hymenobacter lutimineralis]
MRVICRVIAGVAALLLAASCGALTESGRTTVEGQVVAYSSGQPLKGVAKVRPYQAKATTLTTYYTAADQWHDTDANGQFSFAFEADGDYDYVLVAESQWGTTAIIEAPKLRGGRKNKQVQVSVRLPAWLKIHLVDAPPYSKNSQLLVWGMGNSDINISPVPSDTVIVKPVYSLSGQIFWDTLTIYHPQHNADKFEPYSVPEMDTAVVDIHY